MGWSSIFCRSPYRKDAEVHILPDNFWIALPNESDSMRHVKITGKIRITLRKPTTISSSAIALKGVSKIRLQYSRKDPTRSRMRKTLFYYQRKEIGPETAYKMNTGVVEWPFELEVPANVDESVEGLPESSNRYYLIGNICCHSG